MQRFKGNHRSMQSVDNETIKVFSFRKPFLVKYKIYNHYRSQQVHQSYLDRELNVQKILVPAPDEVFQKKELNALIMAATAQMPEKCKQVFMLSRYQHLSHKDISDQLGISVSTVKKHITKATNI